MDHPVVHIPGRDEEQDKPKKLKRTKMKFRMYRRQVMIDDERAEAAFSIGEENFSEGVRRCIDFYLQHNKPL